MDDYWCAVLLGIVEGLTEFLPISSTAHLLLAERMLDMPPEDEYWKMFTIVIQLGAILAVVAYYAGRLRELLADFLFPKRPDGASPGESVPRWRHPVVLILLAVVPAGLVGVLAKTLIDKLMEKAHYIGLALLIGGVLIELIERWTRGRGSVEDVNQVRPGQALAIGVSQVVSLIPGMSRSACTIMGGRLAGLILPAAADFSFLLGIPTMIAATAYSLFKHSTPLDTHQWLVLATGFVTAFVVALLVVVWFLRYVRSHTFRLFVIYRVVVGMGIIVAWKAGWLG